MEKYDVVIVGAGPGGLWCGVKCAESGLKVLVLDKKQEIGTPVRCAEGFNIKWLEREGIQLKESWSGWKVNGAKLYAPNGSYVEVSGEGCIIERKIFELELAKEVTRRGGTVLAKHEVFDVIKEDGRVVGVKAKFFGEEKEFLANVVVAADGFESKISRLAGLDTHNSPYHADSGFEYVVSGIEIDPKHIHLFFGKSIAPRGYIWIFPKDRDTANVGIGIDARSEKKARDYLEEWMEENNLTGSILEVRGGGIPVGGFLREMSTDGFIVIGDAAHQVHPLHGGGIFLAMEAGKMAAEVVAKARERNDYSKRILSEYDRIWWENRGRKLEFLLKIRRALEDMDDDDFNALADVFTQEDILALSSGKLSKIPGIIAKLSKHPRLIRLFKNLI